MQRRVRRCLRSQNVTQKTLVIVVGSGLIQVLMFFVCFLLRIGRSVFLVWDARGSFSFVCALVGNAEARHFCILRFSVD